MFSTMTVSFHTTERFQIFWQLLAKILVPRVCLIIGFVLFLSSFYTWPLCCLHRHLHLVKVSDPFCFVLGGEINWQKERSFSSLCTLHSKFSFRSICVDIHVGGRSRLHILHITGISMTILLTVKIKSCIRIRQTLITFCFLSPAGRLEGSGSDGRLPDGCYLRGNHRACRVRIVGRWRNRQSDERCT